MLIRDMPLEERPRERMLRYGPDALKPSELLAIILRTGAKGVSALELGARLMAEFRTLDRLAAASLAELRKIKGIGPDKAIALKGAFTLAQKMARELREEATIVDCDSVAGLLREEVRDSATENFFVILLDARKKLLRVERLSQGSLNSLVIMPREVFRAAIAGNAVSIIVAHNHPSGDPTPSDEDIRFTRDLLRAGQLLKIELLDHIILGARTELRPKDYLSMREMGLLYG